MFANVMHLLNGRHFDLLSYLIFIRTQLHAYKGEPWSTEKLGAQYLTSAMLCLSCYVKSR